MVTGAKNGCDNFGTQPGLSRNGITGGIVANTGGGSPGATLGDNIEIKMLGEVLTVKTLP